VNDKDSDGISNIFDNCPNEYNPSQYDKDLNGIGDVCDINKNYNSYLQILVGALIFIIIILVFGIMKVAFRKEKTINELSKKSKTASKTVEKPKKKVSKKIK
jgi:hypothetical protein